MGNFMVRLDDELHDEMRAHAEATGIPLADCIRVAVMQHLTAHRRVDLATGGGVHGCRA